MQNYSGFLACATAAVLGFVSQQAVAQQSTPPQKNVMTAGQVTIYTAPADELAATSLADIANAKPMPLPQANMRPLGPDGDAETVPRGKTGFSPGKEGNGQLAPVAVPEENVDDDGTEPEEFGTSNHPYSTARVNTKKNNVQKTYPYSASGKLYFNDGGLSYVCSGSLIKRGVVVTAAHCVSDYGKQRFYTNFQFVPAKFAKLAPFGTWNGGQVTIMSAYYNGTDSCAQTGVICENDIAVISMVPQAGAFPGTKTGWLGYGWDGYGFTPNNLALINQLGYPVSHDKGNVMHRTDSQGFIDGSLAGNTVWGSRQTGGSSGGPEVVNLGMRGKLTTPVGSEDMPNIIVGVTSWQYIDRTIKQLGASPFKASNIVSLVNAICAGGNAACN